MDILRRSQLVHQRVLNQVAGEWVTYRDGDAEVRVKATRAKHIPRDSELEGDYRIESVSDDWLILAAELSYEGSPLTPRPSATITPETGEGVWEVVSGPEDRCFEWSDVRRVRLRIHTNKIV